MLSFFGLIEEKTSKSADYLKTLNYFFTNLTILEFLSLDNLELR